MNRITLNLIFILSVIVYPHAQAEEQKPNVIVILADDI